MFRRFDSPALDTTRPAVAPRSPADAFALFGTVLMAASRERVAAAYLAGDALVGLIVIACGDEVQTILPTATLLRYGLLRGADSILLAHNHPSGDPAPSAEDLRATRRFSDAAAAVDIRLLDHIVVARGGCCSLRVMGLL